ncbi:hypothetical protein PC129_g16516 [Phytophthora cactorum]|uniref:Uncharacterized protein n=1 Tax=Phytophthora cactorum TaxID=29920 RepID=A0A8T1BW28_9STRA|nr:hypothetical protein Pcac1_g20588 [Phytophthora cactorum]KAG2885829.1 hypothetical protein PC114_g19533 [Phytophthora cactorum]KAG2911761.1 hypothetical protein PC117_g19065 [Phytophthora cactorum]KAG2990925.1 hypothetical protein PC119_g19011 [Phytophthora cactorum]KAG3004684.1 hypothetical protein PC120_g18418 [Phytophthora cactorum]
MGRRRREDCVPLKEADPSQRPTALGALLQLKELKQKCFDSETGIGGGKCASE